MANNVTPTEERRAMGLARAAQTCEVCGGRYENTPDGRACGSGCLLPNVPVANGPYTARKKRGPKPSVTPQ